MSAVGVKPKKLFAMPPVPPSTPGAKQPPLPALPTKHKHHDDKGSASPLPIWTASPGDKLAGLPIFRGARLRGGSWLGRMRGLKTKDVAFIGAGLAVLLLAPLAEYLISDSKDPADALVPGFDMKGDVFPNGADPAEMGIQQLARGGLLGENPDVITPANYRDPSSLIMAFGADKPATPPEAGPTPEPKRDAPKADVWDKVVDSAKKGAAAASRKVGLPKPGGKFKGALSGLRGLTGGSSGAKSASLTAPNSKGLFSSPRGSNALTVSQSIPGYRGAGARSTAAGTGGNGFDGRRGEGYGPGGGGSSGDVSGGGISTGGKGTGGSAADGEPTKNPSGSSTKDNKAMGENLEFLRRKMLMEKEMDLKFAKRRYDELERKKMLEQAAMQTAQQALLKILDKLLDKNRGGGGEKKGGGGGGPSGGGGGAPKEDPTNSAPTPTAGTEGMNPPSAGNSQVGQTVPAMGANRDARANVAELGTQSSHLSRTIAPRLMTFVDGINQRDQYGRQIHPPASSAQQKVAAAETAYKGAHEKLVSARGLLETANGQTKTVNTALKGDVANIKTLATTAKADVDILGAEGAEPPGTLPPLGSQTALTAITGRTTQASAVAAIEPVQQDARSRVGDANGTIRGAPRNVDPEISQVQTVLTANPNCTACTSALTALGAANASLASSAAAGEKASRGTGWAVERSGIATIASAGLDELITRRTPDFQDSVTKLGGYRTQMEALRRRWDTEPETARPGIIASADALRVKAAAEVTKLEGFHRTIERKLIDPSPTEGVEAKLGT
ncbi:MAG: hypothetical protein HYZ75_00485 [Elusimicrobia bacterium]|nr:hypothetical protein [Elusimicrobiota bacterium]